MPKYSARQELNCEKQKEKTRIICSSENTVSETTAVAPSVNHLYLVSMKQE